MLHHFSSATWSQHETDAFFTMATQKLEKRGCIGQLPDVSLNMK